jgi:hypothetical protein
MSNRKELRGGPAQFPSSGFRRLTFESPSERAVAEDGHTPHFQTGSYKNAFAGFLNFFLYLLPMFETISAQLITAADKLSHLRRFL